MFAPEGRTIETAAGSIYHVQEAEWLAGFGIRPERVTLSQNKGWLAFDATTEEARDLLHTEYHLYEHTALGLTAPACDR